MYVYAGIDEAGYGPMFGPLLVGRMVLGLPQLSAQSDPEALAEWTGGQLWKQLDKAVCRELTRRQGRIAVNDSKKLHTARHRTRSDQASKPSSQPGSVLPLDGSVARSLEGLPLNDFKHLEHLERGVLAFAALAGHQAADVGQWLDGLGERAHHDLSGLPWYAPTPQQPWGPLPCACTPGEIAVACSLLAATAQKIGLEVLDLGAAVVFEDRFNRMVAATRSKASTSFTFVAGHLRAIWERFGAHHPKVVVDRQSGRMHYRELLALTFPEAELAILDETPERSAYRLVESSRQASASPFDGSPRAMTISFEVDSESQHMPVALASMVSKYTRELLMARFQAWFLERAPRIKPTAGYALDAKRFWEEIQPLLPQLAIDPKQLARSC